MDNRQKNKFSRVDFIIILVIVGLIVLMVWRVKSGNSSFSPDVATSTDAISYEDYNGKKIGILTGTNMEQESFDHFPDSEYFYYDGYPNLNTALENGSIDAYLGDEAALKDIHSQNPTINFIK